MSSAGENHAIEACLHRTNALASLCDAGGWIDDASLSWRIARRDAAAMVVAVKFDEVTMKGGGCVAQRLPRFGWLRLTPYGDGFRAEPD